MDTVGKSHLPAKSSISSHYARCTRSFAKLRLLLESPNLSGLLDDLGRFRVWAANAGAHRTGGGSLDYHLREASHVHTQVTKLLGDLYKGLEEGLCRLFEHELLLVSWYISLQNWEAIGIIQGDDSDKSGVGEISLGVDLDAELGPTEEDELETSELECVLRDITHIVTCLYKFSIAVRNPVPWERIQKIASINISHFEELDIQHISERFPMASIYLIERLGKANTRRRQLLQYFKEYHNKVARYIDVSDELIENTPGLAHAATGPENIGDKPASVTEVTPTISTVLKPHTTVTTPPKETINIIDVESDENQLSQTPVNKSKVTTLVPIPPPPNEATAYDGQPFECPYCFQVIKIGNRCAWR